MNYSLSSARKIGGYIQKIITTQNGAAKAASSSYLSTLQTWHALFAGFDPIDRTVGTIKYNGFTETESEESGNTGTLVDITVTVVSLTSGNPKTITTKINDVSKTNLTTDINAAFTRLIGSAVNTANNYLVSAILNLH